MIRLLNNSDKKYQFTLTKNPVTNAQQSPEPTGKRLEDAKNNVEREAILKHINYSENEVVYLRPGMNEFENDEWAEYIYMTLGNPEEGGVIPIGAGQTVKVKNRNFVLEVNEKGEEIKDNLWNKYRRPQGAQINTTIDPELFKLQPA